MPGTFDQLSRKVLRVPCTVFAGDSPAADTSTVKAAISFFMGQGASEIIAWTASYSTSSGTTPGLTLTLERGTTVLDTLVIVDAANVGTPVRNQGLAIRWTDGDVLNVKAAAGNTDNAFLSLVIILWVQPILDENAA